MQQSQITSGIGGAAQGAAIGSSFGPVGAAVGGVLGGLAGFLGGGGEDDAKELARDRARMIALQGEQNARQMQLQRGQAVGLGRAAIGASNIQFSGSSKRYLRALDNEFSKQIAWQRTKTKMEERQALKGGDVAASQIQSMGISSMLSGLGTLGTTYNNLKK